MKKIIPFILIFSVIFTCFAGCSFKSVKSDKLSIVTTCFPPYDFARAVKGDSDGITMLLSPGAEAHSYEPTPLDILNISQCDIFIYIGGEDEVWVEDILDSIDTSNITLVKLIDSADLLEEIEVEGASNHEHHHDHDEDEHCEECEHEGHEEHEHGYDDHIWTSPKNAAKMTQAISEAIISNDTANADTYKTNTENYISQLDLLDSDFKEMTENSPNNTIVIGDRFPFRYLAAEYNLDYYAAFSGCSSESEPGIYTMAYLINKLTEPQNNYVFYLEFSTKRLAQKLSDATNAKMLQLQSCHNVSKSDFKKGVTYIDLMRQNLVNLREALS